MPKNNTLIKIHLEMPFRTKHNKTNNTSTPLKMANKNSFQLTVLHLKCWFYASCRINLPCAFFCFLVSVTIFPQNQLFNIVPFGLFTSLLVRSQPKAILHRSRYQPSTLECSVFRVCGQGIVRTDVWWENFNQFTECTEHTHRQQRV